MSFYALVASGVCQGSLLGSLWEDCTCKIHSEYRAWDWPNAFQLSVQIWAQSAGAIQSPPCTYKTESYEKGTSKPPGNMLPKRIIDHSLTNQSLMKTALHDGGANRQEHILFLSSTYFVCLSSRFAPPVLYRCVSVEQLEHYFLPRAFILLLCKPAVSGNYEYDVTCRDPRLGLWMTWSEISANRLRWISNHVLLSDGSILKSPSFVVFQVPCSIMLQSVLIRTGQLQLVQLALISNFSHFLFHFLPFSALQC